MLQQTSVARVEPAFRRFLEAYPTPEHLAAANSADVIVAWGDLGYLRRARNLASAARLIAARGWPADLTELPGVGQYTAAAVRTFADGAVVPAVDINLRRVLSRWSGAALDQRQAQTAAYDEIDPERPGDWNQAMMDLGATLCRPRAPRCDACPVSAWCQDASIELPTIRQSRYDGSVRQARAAALKYLARSGVGSEAQLVASLGLDPAVMREALGALDAEAVVIRDGGTIRLA